MASFYSQQYMGPLEQKCLSAPNSCDASDLARARLLDDNNRRIKSSIDSANKENDFQSMKKTYEDEFGSYEDGMKALNPNLAKLDFRTSKVGDYLNAINDDAKYMQSPEFMQIVSGMDAPRLEKFDKNSKILSDENSPENRISDALVNSVLGKETPEYEQYYAEKYPDGPGIGDVATELLEYGFTPTAIAANIRDYANGRVPGLIDLLDFVPGVAGTVAAVKGAKTYNRMKKAGRGVKDYRRVVKAGKGWGRADDIAREKYGERHSLNPGGIDPHELQFRP